MQTECTTWSVRSCRIHKWLVCVFQSLRLNVIIPYRCLLHSLHCGDGCSFWDFMRFVFFPFLEHFWTESESFSSSRFFSDIPACALPALETLFILVQLPLAQHSNHTQALFIELWGAKSLTHSVTHINLPPRCPLCLSPRSPNAISLSLSEPDEKTYDHLNKHRHSMASLSARLWGEVSFMWRLYVDVSLCTDIIAVAYLCAWGLHVSVT